MHAFRIRSMSNVTRVNDVAPRPPILKEIDWKCPEIFNKNYYDKSEYHEGVLVQAVFMFMKINKFYFF